MRGNDLLQAMNNLDDEMIEKSMRAAENKTRVKAMRAKAVLKWSAVAAALLLSFGGGVAYAAKFGITRNAVNYPGYQLEITSRRAAEDEFSEEILAVKKELKKDIAASKESTEGKVFGWIRDFASVEDAVAFIGHSELKTVKVSGESDQTGVVVVGNDQAEILYVEYFSRCYLENNSFILSESARIYTDNATFKTFAGQNDTGLLEAQKAKEGYRDETYITPTGKEAVIMLPPNYMVGMIDGYLVDGSVLYQLEIIYQAGGEEQAIQLMKEWLNQF